MASRIVWGRLGGDLGVEEITAGTDRPVFALFGELIEKTGTSNNFMNIPLICPHDQTLLIEAADCFACFAFGHYNNWS